MTRLAAPHVTEPSTPRGMVTWAPAYAGVTPIASGTLVRKAGDRTNYSPYRPITEIEQTFWCGKPPRLWVTP